MDDDDLFDIILNLCYLAEKKDFRSLAEGLESCLDLYLLERAQKEADACGSQPRCNHSQVEQRLVLKLPPRRRETKFGT